MTTNAPAAKKQEAIVFIEFLRIFACFSVIVNHTNSDIFLETTPGPLWFSSVFYLFLSRTAVPVFLMIAGYLMLDKQYTCKKALTLALRNLGCLFLFSGGYYVSYRLTGQIPGINPTFFLGWIFREPITNAFWYLYMYLGVLVMMPFFQKMAAGMAKRDFHVFFLIYGLFFGTLPLIAHFFPQIALSDQFSLPIFCNYFCMLLVGCYLRRYCCPSKKWGLVCLGYYLLICAVSVALTYWEYQKNRGQDYLFWSNNNYLPLLLACAAVFYGASCLHFGSMAKKWSLAFGRLTFGIYLFSDFFVDRLQFLYQAMVTAGLPEMAAVIVYDLLVFFAGAACTWILKKLPVLRKIL